MNRQSSVKKGIIIAVILACVVAIIGGTYARYSSTGTATATAAIATWHVELNGANISSAPVTQTVPLTYAPNAYVVNGKIAPGRSATFDVVLNPAGSEVAIDYNLKVDTSAIQGITNSASNIAVTGATYKIGDGAAQTATVTGTDGVTISEGLTDVEAGKVVTMTVTLSWDNDDEKNAADTANGVAAGTITVPVTVTASQHI